MSQPKGPISHVVEPIAEHMAKIQALPPDEKHRHRVAVGAGLLGFCGWIGGLVLMGMLATGLGVSGSAPDQSGAPPLPPEALWIGAAVLVGLIALGVLLLAAGLRRTRGQPRDMIVAAKALARLALFSALLWWRWFPVPDGNTLDAWTALGFLFLPGIYIGGVTESLMMLFISLRGPQLRARRVVQKHMEENAIPWKPTQRRQF